MVDTWITISSTILQNNNQELLIVGLEKEMHKMSLEHLVVPEGNLQLSTQFLITHRDMYAHSGGFMSETCMSSESTSDGQSYNNLSKKVSTLVLIIIQNK